MGSSSSKVARSATRKYPARAPGSTIPSATTQRARPIANPKPASAPASAGDGSKDHAIRADSMDPDFVTGDFSRRLQQMGVVDPNPTYSPSSSAAPNLGPTAPLGPTFAPSRSNPTLSALEARQRLQRQAEEDFEAMGLANSQGRRFLDMRTVVDAMKLRGRGLANGEIERRLRIQPGLLEKLGRENTLSYVTSP